MLNRIFGQSGKQVAPKPPGYYPFSLFGEPLHYFSKLPTANQQVWHLSAMGHTPFRMALGMAWLNHLPVRIFTGDERHRTTAMQWARDAAEEALNIDAPSPPAKKDDRIPIEELIQRWRKECKQWSDSMDQVSQIRFGVINTLEAAFTLLRLHPSVDRFPFTWADRRDLTWTPSEFEKLLQALKQAAAHHEGLINLSSISRMDIQLRVLDSWTETTFHQVISDRLSRLDARIRDYERCLVKLRALLAHTLAQTTPTIHPDTALGRLSLTGLDQSISLASGLHQWQLEFKMLEQELISDGWFRQFKGIQSISLEETSQELNLLHSRFTFLQSWTSSLFAANKARKWLNEQPSIVQKWLDGNVRMSMQDLQTPFTYWYLHGWLEQAVSPKLWKDLSETPERKVLAQQLPQRFAEIFQQGIQRQWFSDDPDKWWSVHSLSDWKEPNPGGIDLFWTGENASVPEMAFSLEEPENPVFSLEYLRLQQAPVTEAHYDAFALPYPLSHMEGLWEATPGRWLSPKPAAPLIEPLAVT